MPLRKHDYHLENLSLPALAAGSAADTSAIWTYHFNPLDVGVFDPTVEYVLEACFVTEANVTGVATNNFAIQLIQYNSTGTIKNQINYTFASGNNATAYNPVDLVAAVGGALTNPTGVTLVGGWPLVPGDTIGMKRASNGTGLASPAFAVTFGVGIKA